MQEAVQILMQQNGEMKLMLEQSRYGGTYNEIEGEPPFGNTHPEVKGSTHPQDSARKPGLESD